jgi:KaiC/GvpD/RAD55 family RecA-like ATPase
MSGGKGGVKTIKDNLTYLLHFDIILCCDQDKPGLSTLEELKRLFPPVRTKTVTYPGLGSKDANSILMESGEDELLDLFNKATAIMPNEITYGDELVDSSLSLFLDDNRRIGPSTGYPTLDKIIGGYAPGKLIMLAGDTGDGKSTVVSNLCYNAIQTGLHPLIVPLEMTADQMMLGLVGIELGVNLLGDPNAINLVSPELYRATAKPLSHKATWAKKYGVMDMEDFSNKVKTAVAVFGSKLIILDHITAATVGSDWQTMEKYAYRLKELALQHDVCLFVISHITVKSGGVEDKDLDIRKKRLTKDSLRGSKAFSQVPDVVIGIERKDPYCILYPIKFDRFVNIKEDCVLKWNVGRLTEHNGKLQKQSRKTIPSDASKPGIRTKDIQDSQQPESISIVAECSGEQQMPSISSEFDIPSIKGDADTVHPRLVPTPTGQVLRDQGGHYPERRKKAQGRVSAVRDMFGIDPLHSEGRADSE